jgi:hypothetical protein
MSFWSCFSDCADVLALSPGCPSLLTSPAKSEIVEDGFSK